MLRENCHDGEHSIYILCILMESICLIYHGTQKACRNIHLHSHAIQLETTVTTGYGAKISIDTSGMKLKKNIGSGRARIKTKEAY